MPMIWVEPEVFLEHEGVTVYHAYKHGGLGSRLRYWFNTDPDETDVFDFDVRSLPDWTDDGSADSTIRSAIDHGLIPCPEPEGRNA
jgi:hypothetical protein